MRSIWASINEAQTRSRREVRRPALLLLLSAVILLQPGCAWLKPDYTPAPPELIPGSFSRAIEGDARRNRWWEELGSDELDGLVTRALADNFSVQEAWARLKQLRAGEGQARSHQFPELSASIDVSRTDQGTEAGGKWDTSVTESYFLGLASSYELDVWGRLNALRRAAGADADAMEGDLVTAAMTIAARVAETWVSIIAASEEVRLLNRQKEANEKLLELLGFRLRNSLATALDVYQQREGVAQIRAAVPLVERREQLLRHQLAVLLGLPASADLGLATEHLPDLQPLPSTGLPTDLLAHRPDIVAANARLDAAAWRVGAARADRLPAIRLSARAGYSGGEIESIFDNWLANLAAGLTGPILDAGRRAADARRADATLEQQLAAYCGTVLAAVKEVEDALVREQKQLEHVTALEAQLAAARQANEEARQRYLKGALDYLPVLAEVLSVFRIERELITARRTLVLDRIALHRALGGHWGETEDNRQRAASGAKETPR